MRNISFALTTPQFKARTKDVTRRIGWTELRPGAVLCAVEKGQGIPKGGSVTRLGKIRVTNVSYERLDEMTSRPEYGRQECIREGFPDLTPTQFAAMFCKTHPCTGPETVITRIEFDYVEDTHGKSR